ncbi:MAG: sigma-70 family RNA polymerase sigma factor [Chlorobi bacterium]|nr:sigma-70 family RNA polymerase sigma factor [Chlorobiota bacterium]
MQTTFEKLKQHKADQNRADFNELLTKFLPKLERYVRHRIRVMELEKKLPRNYYAPADVIADVYLKIYEKFDEIHDERQLRTEMFKLADEIIQDYVNQHKYPPKSVPYHDLLKEELKMLEEEFTADADGELVLIEELDDIEYKQDEFKRKIYLFDREAERAFAAALGLSEEDFKDEKFRAIFGNMYANLPDTARHILDLLSQGGLTPEEVAAVMDVKKSDVIAVIERIRKLLKR